MAESAWTLLAVMATETAVLLLGREPNEREAKAMGYGIGALIGVMKANRSLVAKALEEDD